MHSENIPYLFLENTTSKQKTSNLFYFSTLALSILGLITSISYTALYGYEQGTTQFEKVFNTIAYSLIDIMLALFLTYLGKEISEKSRVLQNIKLHFLTCALFMLSTIAMVSDLVTQNAKLENNHYTQKNNQLTKNLQDQIYSITQTEETLKQGLEKIDPIQRPGNYQFIANQLQRLDQTKQQLLTKLPPPTTSAIIPTNTLNSLLAEFFNIKLSTVSSIIKSLWAIFFIASFTTIASIHASIYCDESLIRAQKRQQRLILRAIKNNDKFQKKLQRAKKFVSHSLKSSKIQKLCNYNYLSKYHEVTKAITVLQKSPTQKWLCMEFNLTTKQAKMFLNWMLLDGVIKQYANRQYRIIKAA